MKITSFLSITTDAVILAIAYTLIGIITSFVLYYLFDTFDDKWKKRSPVYQLTDITLEISILASVSFWSSVIIAYLRPILPVSKFFESMIDNYASSTFFLFAIFIFMDELTLKLKHINHVHLEPIFDEIFPKYGSIVDMSLSYKKKYD
uniref:Uncharacterized protein n=1 Tax=viral metagenome TaxID=1070528 RepID=A0A6C0JPY9_9ZZZZ